MAKAKKKSKTKAKTKAKSAKVKPKKTALAKKASAKPVKKAKGSKPAKAKSLKTKTTAPKKSVRKTKPTVSRAKTSAVVAKGKSKPKIQAKIKPKSKSQKKFVARNWQSIFVPLDDRILIRRADEFLQTKGGIFIPDSAAERPNSGTVIAVGRGRRGKKGKIYPLEVRLGDEVLFDKYAGTEIKFMDEAFLIVRESDVIGVVEE